MKNQEWNKILNNTVAKLGSCMMSSDSGNEILVLEQQITN
jgi:hypothetical protein